MDSGACRRIPPPPRSGPSLLPWKDKLPRCFGFANGVFAAHPIERREAREMLTRALAQGATLADVQAEAAAFLKSRRYDDQHVASQLRRIRDLRQYFD